ncbi:MAG: FAD-linked oxidase C-terminal domain-containing protein [Actinomycetota bacterium]
MGDVSLGALRAVKNVMDPDDIMNPGKLLPSPQEKK